MQKYYAIIEDRSWTSDIDGYLNQEAYAITHAIADNEDDAKRLVRKLTLLKAQQIVEEAKADPFIDAKHPFSLATYDGGNERWGYTIRVNDDGMGLTTDNVYDIYYEVFNPNELKEES